MVKSKKLKIGLVMCLFSVSTILVTTFVVLKPANAAVQKPDPRFGINSFILNRYNWDEWDRPIQSIDKLGVGWIREEFVWSQIEPKKGEYDWTFYDRAYSKISDSNLNVLAILDYSAPWSTSDSSRIDADKYMPNISDWREYVGKIIDRYGEKVKYWQIWNEENLQVFLKTTQGATDYFALLKTAYDVIKTKDPGAKVVLGGTSGIDSTFLRALKELGGGDYFDILAVHPYRLDFKSPPESGLIQDIIKSEKISDEFGKKPIWFTELGWPTDSTEGVSEDIQARFLLRTYLMTLSFSDVEKIFWYDLRDDGLDRNYREHNFGIINRDYSEKKSFAVYQNLIKTLGYSKFERANKNGENGIFDYSFIKDGINIRVIWKMDGNDEAVLNDSEDKIKIYDYLGKEIKVPGKDGIKNLPITDSPVFVIGDGNAVIGSNISYGQTFEYEYVAQSPNISLRRNEEKEIWLKIKNTGNALWVQDNIVLGTCRNLDRRSGFFVDGNWVGANRPARMEEGFVKSGEVATFRFTMKSNGLPIGDYKEYFCPLIEGRKWMRDIGIYWKIRVD